MKYGRHAFVCCPYFYACYFMLYKAEINIAYNGELYYTGQERWGKTPMTKNADLSADQC